MRYLFIFIFSIISILPRLSFSSALVRLDTESSVVYIESHYVFYGNVATQGLAVEIARDIQDAWNEPEASVAIDGQPYDVIFRISGKSVSEEIAYKTAKFNDDIRVNFVRLEKVTDLEKLEKKPGRDRMLYSTHKLGSNYAFFVLQNNEAMRAKTAAHEYGHGIGFIHPIFQAKDGSLAIMHPNNVKLYPQCSSFFSTGIDLSMRVVTQENIDRLRLDILDFKDNISQIGYLGNAIYNQDRSMLLAPELVIPNENIAIPHIIHGGYNCFQKDRPRNRMHSK